jgi:integrase
MDAFIRLYETLPPNIYGLIFLSPSSKYKVINNTNANKLLRKTLEGLGIDPITMHGLRYTHVSVLLYKKISLNFVSGRLGHKDIETTYNYYSHVIKELREED